MARATIVFVLACFHVLAFTFAENIQEVNIETNEDDPLITKMYAKEIEDGDNAELPLRSGHHKHHKGHKKHGFLHGGYHGGIHSGYHGGIHSGYHGGIHGGYHGGIHGGYHGGINGGFHHNTHHVPLGLPVDDGLGVPYGHGMPYLHHGGHIGHHLPIGHGPELPIIPIDNHHHNVHHGHFAHYPEYMPLPYALPMCVMGKLFHTVSQSCSPKFSTPFKYNVVEILSRDIV